MEAVEDEVESGSAEEVESGSAEEEEEEEEDEEEEAVTNPAVEQLQSEVKELRRQLDEIEREKKTVMKRTHDLEDRQVKNWKLIQEATKFSGVSVDKLSDNSCTFYFHPMCKSTYYDAYAMTVKFTKKGYEIGKCYLPESIDELDLDHTKPLEKLVWDISKLVDCFTNRQQQIVELEELFGKNSDRSVNASCDTLKVMVQVKASDESDKNFNVSISLNYKSDEILPYNVDLEFEKTQDFSDETMADFELHCNPFFKLPLLKAFQAAF
ncbi:uncharacterized protein LOC124349931 [Daphnia pulicaria]|uniref:uncharacterized protein LOC124349931 n=1 Tax=Daphnia pulicaria TaxID=35523 RepID=UPI001EEB9600|nr:uncharacterized protein LOC124349931 [Daphnia pulicaria]XP_046656834.1 uncharacterized protein LOC124349931 [Daphnia pulicaria]XP_046656835.1 uncharacterized protein LOC124349931 [Daphnia pulicaria]